MIFSDKHISISSHKFKHQINTKGFVTVPKSPVEWGFLLYRSLFSQIKTNIKYLSDILYRILVEICSPIKLQNIFIL